jgi:hypothetical protein
VTTDGNKTGALRADLALSWASHFFVDLSDSKGYEVASDVVLRVVQVARAREACIAGEIVGKLVPW